MLFTGFTMLCKGNIYEIFLIKVFCIDDKIFIIQNCIEIFFVSWKCYISVSINSRNIMIVINSDVNHFPIIKLADTSYFVDDFILVW